MLDVGSCWVEFVGDLLEPAGSRLDVVFGVRRIMITSSPKESVELLAECHGVDDDGVIAFEVPDADRQRRPITRRPDEHRRHLLKWDAAHCATDGVARCPFGEPVLGRWLPDARLDNTSCLWVAANPARLRPTTDSR